MRLTAPIAVASILLWTGMLHAQPATQPTTATVPTPHTDDGPPALTAPASTNSLAVTPAPTSTPPVTVTSTATTASATTAPITAAPTSPAFDAIGATPTTIAQPISIRAMGASLLSFVDQSGHVNAGLAMEAAPLWLMLGDNVTLKDWRENYGDRAMSRLTVSFASAASASGLTSVAEGARFVIWDDTDPRFDRALEACLVDATKKALPQRGGGDLPVDTDNNDTSPVVSDSAVKACQDAAKARTKTTSSRSSGAVSTAITEQQDTKGDASLGKVFAWFSASSDLGKGARWLSVLGSLRYVYNHPGSEFDGGARIRAGNNDLGISVDGAWTPTVSQKKFHGEAGVVGLNGELRITNNFWLSATAGGKFGKDSGAATDLFSVLHFKFATESAASITPATSQ